METNFETKELEVETDHAETDGDSIEMANTADVVTTSATGEMSLAYEAREEEADRSVSSAAAGSSSGDSDEDDEETSEDDWYDANEEITTGAVGGQTAASTSEVIRWSKVNNTERSVATMSLQSIFAIQRISPLSDPVEDMLRETFIKHVTTFQGAPLAPSSDFELQWIVYQDELVEYIARGLVPQDMVNSAGLDETSYKHMKQCSDILQDYLFEGKLLESLSNLRGFRRLFSKSSDPVIKHAFRGRPVEVLQNIYYGGDGILPEDRMLLDDPFHYTVNTDDLDT